jgi:hypothetical protein
MGKAADIGGRRLVFSNVDMSGGFVARYADTGEPYPGGHVCWVGDVLCRADEHRFGGIVVERCDLTAPGIDLQDARITLPCALVWRFITEVVRRRHRTHRIRLQQWHPGISPHGVSGLALAPNGGGPGTTFELWLGGGEPGRVDCDGRAGSYPLGNVWNLLGENSVAALDRFEEMSGLAPAPSVLPPSSAFVQVHRLVATLLERLVFDRRSWRATLAIAGTSSGWLVADWHAALIDPLGPRAPSSLDETAHRRLAQLVLVHSVGSGACFAREEIAGTALAFDVGTGRIAAVTAKASRTLGTIAELRAEAGSYPNLVQQLLARLGL